MASLDSLLSSFPSLRSLAEGMHKRTAISVGCFLLTFSLPSFAHFPFCECVMKADEIHCSAGFSDGSGASGVTVDLISYDEEIIQQNNFSETSTAQFTPYDGEFYILLDAGPGHTVEVDWHDIQDLNR